MKVAITIATTMHKASVIVDSKLSQILIFSLIGSLWVNENTIGELVSPIIEPRSKPFKIGHWKKRT